MQADILASVPQLLGYVKKSGSWNVPGRYQQSRIGDGHLDSTFSHGQVHANSIVASATQNGTTISFSSTSDVSWDHPFDDETISTHEIGSSVSSPSSSGYALLWPLWFAGFIIHGPGHERCTNLLRQTSSEDRPGNGHSAGLNSREVDRDQHRA